MKIKRYLAFTALFIALLMVANSASALWIRFQSSRVSADLSGPASAT